MRLTPYEGDSREIHRSFHHVRIQREVLSARGQPPPNHAGFLASHFQSPELAASVYKLHGLWPSSQQLNRLQSLQNRFSLMLFSCIRWPRELDKNSDAWVLHIGSESPRWQPRICIFNNSSGDSNALQHLKTLALWYFFKKFYFLTHLSFKLKIQIVCK